MANISIFKKCKLVTTTKWTQTLIGEYIDQTRKANAVTVAQAEENAPTESAYKELVARKKAPLRPGKDFIESTSLPPVRVYGFLGSVLRGVGSSKAAPRTLADDLSFLAEYWEKQTASKKKKAYHLVWSVAPEIQKRALEAGIPVSEILFSSAIASLSAYNAWLHPESSLGFILGFHSDKPNTHLHGLLFPQTEAGTPLNLSRMAPIAYGSRKIRLDCQGYIHRSYLESIDDIDSGIQNGVPRVSLPTNSAYSRAVLGNVIQTVMAESFVGEGKGSFEEGLAKVAPSVFDLLVDKEVLAGVRASAEETSRSIYALYRSGSRKEAHEMLESATSTFKESVAASVSRRKAIRSAFNAIESRRMQIKASPDRASAAKYLSAGLRLPTGGDASVVDHLGDPGQHEQALNNPFLMEDKLRARRENIDALHRQLSRARKQFSDALGQPSCYSMERAARILAASIKLADAVAAVSRSDPVYLRDEVLPDRANDFIDAPDHGASLINNHRSEMWQKLLLRKMPMNPDTDANRVLGPVVADTDDADEGAEEIEVRPPGPGITDMLPEVAPASNKMGALEKQVADYYDKFNQSQRKKSVASSSAPDINL